MIFVNYTIQLNAFSSQIKVKCSTNPSKTVEITKLDPTIVYNDMFKQSLNVVMLERLSQEFIDKATQHQRPQAEEQPQKQQMNEQQQQQPFSYEDIFGDISDDEINDHQDDEIPVPDKKDGDCGDKTPHIASNENAADIMPLANTEKLVLTDTPEICVSSESSPEKPADDTISKDTDTGKSPETNGNVLEQTSDMETSNTENYASQNSSEDEYLTAKTSNTDNPASQVSSEDEFFTAETSSTKHIDDAYTNALEPQEINGNGCLSPISSPNVLLNGNRCLSPISSSKVLINAQSEHSERRQLEQSFGNACLTPMSSPTADMNSKIGTQSECLDIRRFGYLTPLTSPYDGDIIFESDNESFVTVSDASYHGI